MQTLYLLLNKEYNGFVYLYRNLIDLVLWKLKLYGYVIKDKW